MTVNLRYTAQAHLLSEPRRKCFKASDLHLPNSVPLHLALKHPASHPQCRAPSSGVLPADSFSSHPALQAANTTQAALPAVLNAPRAAGVKSPVSHTTASTAHLQKPAECSAGSTAPTSCSSPCRRLTSVKWADFSFQPSSLKPPEGSLKQNRLRAAHKKYSISEHPKLLAQVWHNRLNAAHHTLPAFGCSELSVNGSGKAPTWLQSSSRDF